jgi:integrase
VTVYARNESWSYRLELERHTLTDKRQWEYVHGFESEEAAWTAGIRAKEDLSRGQRVSPDRRTVTAFFTQWLSSIKESVKPSTYVNYKDYWEAYVEPAIGTSKLQKLDVPKLNAFYQHLLDDGRRKSDTNWLMYQYWSARRKAGADPKPKEVAEHCGVPIYGAQKAVLRYQRGRVPVRKDPGLSPKTVKNVHRLMHRALSDAVAWRYIEYNPAIHASLPRTKRRRRIRPGATWTQDELIAWLEVALKDRDAGMWALVASTGMRRSELAGSERGLLDLEKGTLAMFDTRVVVDGHAMDSDGKTASGERTISVDSFTVEFLRLHLERLDDERATFGHGYSEAGKLFCHPDGRPIHPDTITRRFNRLVDQAGVSRIRLHDVRHTYATLSLDAGIDPKIVSDRIGHSNMAYTLQIYTHPSTGRDRKAAETVAGLIFGISTHPKKSPRPSSSPTGGISPREHQ